MAGTTPVLASTAGVMLAADVPLPIELTAMAMVGLVLRWLIRRDSRKDLDTEKRLLELERNADRQRHLKHAYLNMLNVLLGALRLARRQADGCECGSMETLLPMLDEMIANADQRLADLAT